MANRLPLRILYVGNFLLPDGNAAATRALSNSRLLAMAGAETTLLGYAEGRETARWTAFPGVHCVALSRTSSDAASFAAGDSNVLAELSSFKGDAVLLYNYPSLASLRIWMQAKKCGMVVLADATEWYGATAGPITRRAAKAVDVAMRMRLMLPRMDALVTTSPWMTERYAGKVSHICELPSLFDRESFTPDLSNRSDVPSLVYAGSPFDASRVTRQRDNVKDRLDRTLQRLRTVADEGLSFRYDIFGVSLPEFLQVYPELGALTSSLHQSVRFHGRQPRERVLQAVAAADFTLFFRDSGRTVLAGFPTRMAESITAGTPVITSALPNLKPYGDTPGLMLASQEQELSTLRSALSLPPAERAALKTAAWGSQRFDYRRYEREAALLVEHIASLRHKGRCP